MRTTSTTTTMMKTPKTKMSNGNADGDKTSPALYARADGDLNFRDPEDQDDGDVGQGVDEDALDSDDLDDDAVSSPAPTASS